MLDAASAAAPIQQSPRATPTRPGAAPADSAPPPSDGEFLSNLNPLQYIPLIGTLYRALTGDRGNETVRTAGSLAFSGVLGGPIGLAISFGALLFEKMTGFDPERIGERVVADLGWAPARTAAAAPAVPPVAAAAAPAATAPAASPTAAVPLSMAQLAAYGAWQDSDGTLRMDGLRGADVLNAIELARHDPARVMAAYRAGSSP